MIQVLLIEDDPNHAELIRAHIARKHGSLIHLQWEKKLATGLELLTSKPFDVILLDLGLPDSDIDATLAAVLPVAKGTPVVVLSSLEDEDFALAAVHQGAQDYLCKQQLSGELLYRSLLYAIERKAVEESLRSALRAKDEFLTVLSHELRTPVGVIQGCAELLLGGGLSEEECRQIVEKIFFHSKMQVRLIDDILEMSDIVTGNLTLHRQLVDLGRLVNAATASVQLAAETKNITLRVACESPIGLVLGDPLRLQQIIWNLLSNALKFTSKGRLIEVRLRRLRAPDQVEIDVEDNGEGIAPEFLPFVFDRFSQQDRSKSRRAGGLGIGLAIVKYLVEMHGGRVTAVSSGTGKGATFSIFLPSRVAADGVLEDAKATAVPPGAPFMTEGGRVARPYLG